MNVKQFHIYLNLVHLIGKGTVSFCLSKNFIEKEIKEIKKSRNYNKNR